MDLTAYLKYAGSIARTATLLQAEFSERTIRNSLAAGEITRLRHGVVALRGAAPDLVGAVLANGLLSCVSAAPHHGLRRLHDPDRLHLLCRHGSAAGIVIHRGSVVPREFPRPVAGLTDTLNLVDGTADSAIEVVARLLFRSEGIYTHTQVELPGIGIVDFLLEGFLIIEVDGSSHLEPRQVKKDRGRNNASTLTGYAVLRYGYQEVVYKQQKVLEEVWQVLRGRVVR